MKKFVSLILVLMLAMAVVPFSSADNHGGDVAESVMEAVMEYGENLPEGYGVVAVDAFNAELAENPDLIILDVREEGELEEGGHIEGAIHIPIRELPANLDLLPDTDAEIVVVCAAGARAMIAQSALNLIGYENARTLKGGIRAWIGEDYPVTEGLPENPEPAEAPEIDEDLFAAFEGYIGELPEGCSLVRAAPLNEELIENPDIILLDVRSEDEWNDVGYIEGAEWMWVDEFTANMDMWPEDKDAEIVVYCASSYRGGIAMSILDFMGYTNVRNLAGGINAWLAEDLPVAMAE